MMQRELIQVPLVTPPILTVVVHTEEEFDWAKQHTRNAISVTHMRHIDRVQDIFDEFGIVPNYVVDYPIAAQEEAVAPLRAFAASGRALIGAHLHPWVSPPYEETVCARNSYPGNLPLALEEAKLRLLTEIITESFGVPPLTYLAGRYGFGPNTGGILERLGYEVDISPAPPINFKADGGPDYSGFTCHPYWFGAGRRLLGLPGTGAYVGWLRAGGTPLYSLMTHPRLSWAHLPGILSRMRAIERIRLSPEDYTDAEMRRLTRQLLRLGLRNFVFSFHSPSVHPGFTPYVQSTADLQKFLDKCCRYFTFFLEELGGESMTPLEVKGLLA